MRRLAGNALIPLLWEGPLIVHSFYFYSMVKKKRFWIQDTGVWIPWDTGLVTYHSFLICKMEIIIGPTTHRVLRCCVKHIEQCLAQRKHWCFDYYYFLSHLFYTSLLVFHHTQKFFLLINRTVPFWGSLTDLSYNWVMPFHHFHICSLTSHISRVFLCEIFARMR